MKKIMLPFYNDMTVFLSTIFDKLGFKIDYMGRPTKKTRELATKYSPEQWCFDTKLMLGQLVEGVKRGNNILVSPGAWGGKNENCLLGYLCQGVLEKRIEKVLGKKIKIWYFNVNPIEIVFSGYFAAYKNISMLRKYAKVSRIKILKAIFLGIKKMKRAAEIKERMLESANVANKERLFSIYERFLKEMIYEADTKEKAQRIYEEALFDISKLKKKKIKKKIKIGIVGDYDHTLFSLFPFFDIERFLLKEDVVVKQPLNFINYYSVFSPLYKSKNRKKLKELFPKNVTGSDAITILSAIYLKDKVDGIIHVGTFSCTPEEVANEVLLANKKIFPPILSLSYDAHTHEENLKVRVEAFIDMLRAKK